MEPLYAELTGFLPPEAFVPFPDAADCRSPHDSLPQTQSEIGRISSAPLPNKS